MLEVSPDLRLQGAGPYHLSGKVLIPLAAIELQEVPSGTVDVSSDEIIVGEQAVEERSTGAKNLTARVRVELGEAVTFEFVADQAGTYSFYCSEFCSALHLEMMGYLLVKPS